MEYLTFGEAIEALKRGEKVCRSGWNGKGMWLYLVEGSILEDNSLIRSPQIQAQPVPLKINSHIDMKSADGSIVIGWLASQTDMLSEDWVVV